MKNTRYNNLKSLVIIALAFCQAILWSSSATAQKGFDFGMRYMLEESALLNKTDMSAGPELDYANTFSYISWGIAGSYSFNANAGIELDVLYSRQGQEFSGNFIQTSNSPSYNNVVYLQAALNNSQASGEYQAKAELNVFKIPVLFKLTSDKGNKVFYSVSAGPQLNILKSTVFELNKEDVGLPGISIQPADVYEKITLDGVLSLGVGYNVSPHFILSGQIRLDYGFQDAEKKDIQFNYPASGNNNINYYGTGRAATHNATAALMIGLDYKL